MKMAQLNVHAKLDLLLVLGGITFLLLVYGMTNLERYSVFYDI